MPGQGPHACSGADGAQFGAVGDLPDDDLVVVIACGDFCAVRRECESSDVLAGGERAHTGAACGAPELDFSDGTNRKDLFIWAIGHAVDAGVRGVCPDFLQREWVPDLDFSCPIAGGQDRAVDPIVDGAIAVVIFVVTDFCLWLGCVAVFPLACLTDFGAISTT